MLGIFLRSWSRMIRLPILNNIRFLTRDIRFKPVVVNQRSSHSQQHSGIVISSNLSLTNSHELEHAVKDYSYDHFGILSLGSRESIDSAGTNGEKSFLDHLLRAESTSGLNGFHIPTIAEVSELGGHSESMFDHFDAEGSLLQVNEEFFTDNSNAFDATADQRQEQAAINSRDSRVVPLISNSRRMVITEQQRQLRSKLAREHSTELDDNQAIDVPRFFDPSYVRTLYATVDEILLATSSSDIQELRNLLTEKLWPEQREVGRHLQKIFQFIVDKSASCDEAMMFFRDFASSNRRAYISDDCVLYFAIRNLRESGLESTVQLFPMFRNMFIARAPSQNKRQKYYRENLKQLYMVSVDKGGWLAAEKILQSLIDFEFDSDARLFLQVAPSTSFSSGQNFDDTFSHWSLSSTRNASTDGVEVFWGEIFSESDEIIAARNAGRVLRHCRALDHPSKCIAELLGSLIYLDKVETAKLIFAKVSVSGQFFRAPLARYVQAEQGLRFIENLANLISFGLYGERSRGKRKKTTYEVNILSSDLQSVLDSFCGLAKQSKKSSVSVKKFGKKKMHKVDDESLHQIAAEIQTSWMLLCEKSQDMESVERLLLWSQTHNLELSEKLMKRIESLKNSPPR